MSAESVHEIRLGVGFKPYRYYRRFCRQDEGHKPLSIPENYTHGIALRKPISLYGMLGSIDVITDEPYSWLASLTGQPVEKPLGETHFESIYGGPRDEKFTQEPCILRVSFLLKTPAEYIKLIDTHAEIGIGRQRYLMMWGIGRPEIRRNMQALSQGEQRLVINKTLVNQKLLDETAKESLGEGELDNFDEIADKTEVGRYGYIWLPALLKKLRTIKFTFDRYEDNDEMEPSATPIQPKERVPVLV